jgi:peptidoglycan/LPS O-acetylase OafA/YrhL
MADGPSSKKIVFANQLRGFAVLTVMLEHYVYVYWFARNAVANQLHAPLMAGDPSKVAQFFALPTVNYGPLGVSTFFLISGFVIPLSIEKLGVTRFAIARAFRIFPTYWAASAITLFVTYLSARYWGASFEWEGHRVLANLFLVHEALGHLTIDMVNWTLVIEVMFYVCCCVFLWPFIKRGSVLGIVNFSALVLAYLTWAPASWETLSLSHVQASLVPARLDLMMVCFITLGILFNFHMFGKISLGALASGCATILVMFLTMWKKTAFANAFPGDAYNYMYGFAIFSTCYALRSRFRNIKIVDFFADISYPLYLVHSVTGYTIIRILLDRQVRYVFAAAVAFSCAVAIAYVLHKVVEMPSARYGKRALEAGEPKTPAIA